MLEHAVRARLDPDGLHQVVEVAVRGGYRPSTILARAGVPLRIVFQRNDDDVCSERVIFSKPRVDRHLAPSGATAVELPAQPPGEIRFTCGMGRYRGRIAVVDESRTSLAGRLHEQVSRLEAALGTRIVLLLCSLPLIAVLTLVFIDAKAAIAFAAAALAAWVAGCLWALRASAPSR